MLGSDRFAFETPNVIDPGDMPPSRPSRPEPHQQHLQIQSEEDAMGSVFPTDFLDNNSQIQPVGDANNFPSYYSKKSNNHHGRSQQNGQNSSDDYQHERESTARLLRDIGDLDLTPVPYDPYDDGDPEDQHHSLPSVEDARMYAATLLQKDTERDTVSSPRSAAVAPSAAATISPFSSKRYLSEFQGGHNNKNKEMQPLSLERTVKLETRGGSKHLLRRQIMRWVARIAPLLLLLGVVLTITLVVQGKHEHDPNDKFISDMPYPPPPSSDGHSERYNAALRFVFQNSISRAQDLTVPGTSQYTALKWIADEDLEQLQVPSSLENDPARFVQRYALAVLFFSTEGYEWTGAYDFLTSQDTCAWFHLEAVSTFVENKVALGVSCDANLMVTSLYLPNNNMVGTIPREIIFLTNLQLLGLPFNNVTGTLPEDLSALSTLLYMDLRYNDLTGTIPAGLGNVVNLEVLGLSNNQLHGSVPDSFGSMSRLKTLALDDNMLTGPFSFANYLISMEYLYADGNFFNHSVDELFLADLTRLHELDLSSNFFSSTKFPSHLLQHAALGVLDFADNLLQGPLPSELASNEALEFLSLRNNSLSGEIPTMLGSLSKITHLDLQENNFTGSLPIGMSSMTILTSLYLGHNNLDPTNSMAPFLASLMSLRELSLPSLQLTGEISDWIGNLKSLKLLDLSGNRMKSSIPKSIMNLPQLSYLLLDNNVFTGTIPSQGSALKLLTLHHNGALTGNLTGLCSNSAELATIDCSRSSDIKCDCCQCCQATEATCFVSQIDDLMTSNQGMWEFGFSQAPFSFDPDILDESKLFQVVEPGVSDCLDGNCA